MSLIDDALKRAQAADAAAGRSDERPWIPTPMPDASLARRRRILRVLAIGLPFVALAAGGAWVLRRAASVPAASAAPSASDSPRPAPVRTETPLQIVVVVATPTTPVPLAAAPASTRVRPTRPAPSASAPATEDEHGAEAASAPTAVPRPTGPIAEGRTYSGAVTLPGGGRIELGGIVWSETQPRALLNDRILAIGSYVEGFVVAGIEENRVTLEKDGVKIYLSVK
jgi:hypothetical protein